MAIERILIRPVEGEDPLTILIVTLGLFILINSAAGWIWGFENRGFPRALPDGSADIGGVNVAYESLGIVASCSWSAGCCSCSSTARSSGWRCARRPPTRRRAGSSASTSGAR